MTVRYEGNFEGTIQVRGGRGVGTGGDGGSVEVSGGLVDTSSINVGGNGGGVTVIASNSHAYITGAATPGVLNENFGNPTYITALTDSSGLTLATIYDVSLSFDSYTVTQTVTINGTDAQNFGDLIDQINLQIGQSYQDVTFPGVGAVVAGTLTGLAPDATIYSFNVQFDSQVDLQTITVTGSSAQTYGTLVTAINATMVGGTASIVGGNLRIKSSGTTPPVVIASLFDNNLFFTLDPTYTFNPLVTALGIAEVPVISLPFGYILITSNGCGGSCFGTGSNILDNDYPVYGGANTFLFGALTGWNFESKSNGIDTTYSTHSGPQVFIRGGDSGGTGAGPIYGGTSAGRVTIQGGNAPANGPANNSRENGGTIDILAGDGAGTPGQGGNINLVAGSSGSGFKKGGQAGSVSLTAGDTHGDYPTLTSNAGHISFQAGDGDGGDNPGDVSFEAGSTQDTFAYLDADFTTNPIPITGATPSGLGPGIYDVSFTINGGAPFTVTLSPGNAFPTFQDVINELNNQLLGAFAAIVGNHIRLKTFSTGPTTSIVDNDFPVYGGGNTYLFGALNQWATSENSAAGRNAIGGDIHMDTFFTGEVFAKGPAGVTLVAGIANSAAMSFSTANTAGSSNRNISYYTGNAFTNSATPVVFQYDDINPDFDTVTTRGSFPVKPNSCVAFRLMVSAHNNDFGSSTEFASWHIEGAIARGTAAASTTIVGATSTVQRDTGGNAAAWTAVVSADTTLGGLVITFTTPAFTGFNVSFVIDLEMVSQY